MGAITKKDLDIFRGTYKECMNQETKDMKIYLAWDSQEIFIGNKVGVKVPYGVPKSLYRRIDEKVEELKDSIIEDSKPELQELAESIINKNLDSYFSKFYTKDEIDDIKSNYYTKAQINRKLEDISSGSDIDLSNYYTKPEIDSKFKEFTPDLTGYAKISDVDNEQFLYLTGTEMQTRKDIKMFQMVICTENTATGTTPVYKANQLYSYNGERFKLLSSSGSTDKETITAIIKLFATNWPTSGEISNEQITVSNIYADITKRSIIETYDAYFNGAITKSVKNENNQDDTAKISIDSLVIDKSIAKTYSLEIRATAKAETEDYKYTINNQSSKTCSFYQPWLFGEVNNFVHYKPNTATMETNISTSNATVYLYTTTKLSKNPTSGGFEVPFELTADMISLTVNGVENVKYYEYKLINVNDSKLTINL